MNAGAKPGKARRARAHKFFFGDALTESERRDLPAAYEIDGLADEIATLRVRLKTALGEKPKDYGLMLSGMGVLVRAVSAQYRLSPRARKDLADNFAAVLNSLGDQILPADR
jgi:hypothetical protein